MVEFTAKDRAADAAYELATAPTEGLNNARAELNEIWKSGNLPAQDIGQALEENNLLAPLALYDSANLDADNNGSLSFGELTEARYSGDSDTLTRTLADNLASESELRGYSDISLAELRSMRDTDTPTDPIPGEMNFDPVAISDGQVGKDELAYAYENFNTLDRDSDGYVTSEEIDGRMSAAAGSISEADAAKLRDLSSQVGNLEEADGDDEWGDENSGFTRNDLEKTAADMATDLNEERAAAGEDATSAVSILDSDDDAEEASSDALAALRNGDSSTEDQLAAIKKLVEAGQTTATIQDADGTPLNIRMEVQPVSEGSDRSYVQMFAIDENGRETVVLRAMSDGDGFSQQRDANGNFVSYVGTKWHERNPDSVFGD